MPVNRLTKVDAEVAAATFCHHLDDLWHSGRPTKEGWERIPVDNLHVVVKLPGERPSGEKDWYYILLGAEYYDVWPPTAAFVEPIKWTEASAGSRYFPIIEPKPAWFGLPPSVLLSDGRTAQMICFSFTAEYYMTNHEPNATQRWKQGRHTVAATISRISEVLKPPYYKRPAS